MWLSSFIRAVGRVRGSALGLMLAAMVGGCGFQSLYGTGSDDHGAGIQALAAIGIDQIENRLGQQLRNQLLDRLTPKGEPARALYRLKVTVTEFRTTVAVSEDAFGTRANVTYRAGFLLINPGTQETLYGSESRVVTSYNVLRSEFANLMSQQDAQARAARELSHDIRARLAGYFLQPAPAAGTGQ